MSATVSTRPAVVGTLVWLVAATALGATGALATVRTGPLALGLLLTAIAIGVSTRRRGRRGARDRPW